jgi:hypothetical protein
MPGPTNPVLDWAAVAKPVSKSEWITLAAFFALLVGFALLVLALRPEPQRAFRPDRCLALDRLMQQPQCYDTEHPD